MYGLLLLYLRRIKYLIIYTIVNIFLILLLYIVCYKK